MAKRVASGGIQIDRDIPPPPSRGQYDHYPFRALKIGDSFWTPHVAKVRQAASWFAKRNPPYKFATRAEREGLRVWRIA